MALTPVQQCRLKVADTDVVFQFLSDEEYEYLLSSNYGSVNKAAISAAQIICFKLSQRTDDFVDIFSVRGSARSAEQYRLALELFLKSPDLNPVLQNTQVYAGGISKSDMLANETLDNNTVKLPDQKTCTTECLTNPFIYCG